MLESITLCFKATHFNKWVAHWFSINKQVELGGTLWVTVMVLVNKTVLDEFIFKAFVETEQFLKHKKIQVNMYFLKSLIAQKYYAFDEMDVDIQNYHTFFLHYFKMHFKNKTGHLYHTDEVFVRKVMDCLYDTTVQVIGTDFISKSDFSTYFTQQNSTRDDLDTLVSNVSHFLFEKRFQHTYAGLLSQLDTVNKTIEEKSNTIMNRAYLDLNHSVEDLQEDLQELNQTSYALSQQLHVFKGTFLMGGHTLASYTTLLKQAVSTVQKTFVNEEQIFAEIFQPIFELVDADVAILQSSFQKTLSV